MNQALVQDVVAEVMRRLSTSGGGRTATRAGEDAPANEPSFAPAHRAGEPVGQFGVFNSVDDAVAAAAEAQKKLAKLSLEDRDAIVKLIQRDIPVMKLDGIVIEAPADERASESSERRRRGSRTRGPRLKPEAAETAETAPAAKPHREPRPERPRQEERPRHEERSRQEERPVPRAPRERGKSSSPFGSDGPVPAFLLRPSSTR